MIKIKVNVKYAVLVDNGKEFRFVTKIDNNTNSAEWNAGEDALLFSKGYSEDLAYRLCVNGHVALSVRVPEYILNLGNYE